jgi:propanediol dehydratase small subunit
MSIFLVLILAALAWAAFHGWQLPNSLRYSVRYRPWQGRAWRSSFPTASRKDIRDFLSVVVSAFAFPESEKLHFRPDDEVLGIYRAENPTRRLPDARELDTLARALRERYGLRLEEIWHEGLTLGGLFQRAQQARGSIQPR